MPRFKKEPKEQDAMLEYEIPRTDPETQTCEFYTVDHWKKNIKKNVVMYL